MDLRLPSSNSDFSSADAEWLDNWVIEEEHLIGSLESMHDVDFVDYRRIIALQMALQMWSPDISVFLTTDGMFAAYPAFLIGFDTAHLIGPLAAAFAYWGADTQDGVDFVRTIAVEALDDDTGVLSLREWNKRADAALKKVQAPTLNALKAIANRRLVDYFESYIPPDIIDVIGLYGFMQSPEFRHYCKSALDQNTIYPKL